MNETLTLIIVSLLTLIVIILLWHGVILARLARILEQPSANPKRAPVVETPGSTTQSSPSGSQPQTDFDRFLFEDPTRHQLAKKEQAAAYRAWRKQNGLTWNQ